MTGTNIVILSEAKNLTSHICNHQSLTSLQVKTAKAAGAIAQHLPGSI
jgi:hypothetical protein